MSGHSKDLKSQWELVGHWVEGFKVWRFQSLTLVSRCEKYQSESWQKGHSKFDFWIFTSTSVWNNETFPAGLPRSSKLDYVRLLRSFEIFWVLFQSVLDFGNDPFCFLHVDDFISQHWVSSDEIIFSIFSFDISVQRCSKSSMFYLMFDFKHEGHAHHEISWTPWMPWLCLSQWVNFKETKASKAMKAMKDTKWLLFKTILTSLHSCCILIHTCNGFSRIHQVNGNWSKISWNVYYYQAKHWIDEIKMMISSVNCNWPSNPKVLF